MAADRREEAQQQGRRGRAVDIVIAEHDDRLAIPHRAQQPRHGAIHVAQVQRIGQLVAQPRRQKAGRIVDADAALRQQPPDDFRKTVPLGDRRRDTRIGLAHPPATAAYRSLDPEKRGRRAPQCHAIHPPSSPRRKQGSRG